MGSTRPILKSRIISEHNKTVELLVDWSRCVRTLASLASLEGGHLARCVQKQHQTYEEETVVHSVHVEYRELRKGDNRDYHYKRTLSGDYLSATDLTDLVPTFIPSPST